MTTPDPVDDLLGALKPVDRPADALPVAERAFLNHAAEAKQRGAPAWRAWTRFVEPALVAIFVLIFVVWAFVRVLGG
jgi:hypothetical protein